MKFDELLDLNEAVLSNSIFSEQDITEARQLFLDENIGRAIDRLSVGIAGGVGGGYIGGAVGGLLGVGAGKAAISAGIISGALGLIPASSLVPLMAVSGGSVGLLFGLVYGIYAGYGSMKDKQKRITENTIEQLVKVTKERDDALTQLASDIAQGKDTKTITRKIEKLTKTQQKYGNSLKVSIKNDISDGYMEVKEANKVTKIADVASQGKLTYIDK